MAYGFQLRNALGEDILDQRQALYIQESGTTTASMPLLTEPGGEYRDFVFAPVPTTEFIARPGVSALDLVVNQVVADGFARIEEAQSSGLRRRFVKPLWPKTALAFYKPGSVGISASAELYLGPTYSLRSETPSQGLSFWVGSADYSSSLPYIVLDTAPGPLSGNYGMRIMDAAGEVTFDSRAGLFSIAEVPFVTSATIGDVLDNDATYDITLSKAMPGCYISVPYLSAFRYRGGANPTVHWRPRIRQISDTVLRIDRVQVGAPFNTTLRPRYVHDFAIFVARDPL